MSSLGARGPQARNGIDRAGPRPAPSRRLGRLPAAVPLRKVLTGFKPGMGQGGTRLGLDHPSTGLECVDPMGADTQLLELPNADRLKGVVSFSVHGLVLR